jgi:S1-C subfamily serine protease
VVNSTPDLPSLIQEWQISTAYVECYWVDPDTHTWYEKESGSGLLVSFKSGLTVITNRHVVDSSQYGEATECDVGFHNDNGIYYAVTTVDQPAHYLSGTTLVLPDVPAYGNISFTADGTDVADLSNLKEETMGSSPNISLTDRAKTGHFSCDTTPTGEPIVVLGYPDYGAGAGTYTSIFSNLSITATEGIISGQDGIYFTTSAKLDPGNSGGVAIDENNDCYIGIPTAAIAGSMSSLGRILPANYAVTYGN